MIKLFASKFTLQFKTTYYFATPPPTINFKIQMFKPIQIQAMCQILKTKFFSYNDQIQVYKDIRLLDDKNKLIGVYTPSQAKQKVAQLKKDLVLFNASTNPVICKALNFRKDIISKFYTDVINQHRQEVLKKGKQLKSFKLSPNLTNNELKIKSRQIIQNTKKYPRVKVSMRSPNESLQESVEQKFKYFKSLVSTNVKVIQNYKEKQSLDVQIKQQQQQEQQDQEMVGRKKKKLFSVVLQSAGGQFSRKVDELLSQKPEQSIKKFLMNYVQKLEQSKKDEKVGMISQQYYLEQDDLQKQVDVKSKDIDLKQWAEAYEDVHVDMLKMIEYLELSKKLKQLENIK